MNSFVELLRGTSTSAKFSIATKVIGFWAVVWLVLTGLRHVELPGLAGVGASIAAVVTIVATLLLIFALLRIEGGTLREIGLAYSVKESLPKFLLGVGLGLAVVAGMLFVVLILAPLEIEMSADPNILVVLAKSFAVLFVLALMEELVFRSYPLFRLREAFGIRTAIYVTSIAFAFYHGFAIGSLIGPGVWGLFFGYMAISTNSIALPTGFHLGLNWLQALVGMKPQYGDSIWELSVGTSSKPFAVETTGLLLQIVLLVVGVVMIEKLVRKDQRAS